MKKIIFGIFAHPDDEAFGPCGTLLLETRAGADLHLVTLTSGDAGANPDNVTNLGETRLHEWDTAGALLGATSMHYYGYKDGELNNKIMIDSARRIVELVTATLKDAPEDAIVELMTLDLNGLTGHIDHIVAARAACLAFYRLKVIDARLDHIRFACFAADDFKQNTDWLYAENGHSNDEIDETIDARKLREDILQIMQVHHTQRADYAANIALFGNILGLNHFIVKR